MQRVLQVPDSASSRSTGASHPWFELCAVWCYRRGHAAAARCSALPEPGDSALADAATVKSQDLAVTVTITVTVTDHYASSRADQERLGRCRRWCAGVQRKLKMPQESIENQPFFMPAMVSSFSSIIMRRIGNTRWYSSGSSF